MASPTPVRPIERAQMSSGTGAFDQFLAAVAARHLAAWLPAEPGVILDLSPGARGLLTLMLERGHTVLRPEPGLRPPDIRPSSSGRLLPVCADPLLPDWLADACLDAIVAECGWLSSALAAEMTLERLHRALRPGGRMLLCVDSLVAGLARLADQGRWAELADVPAADVVLIPEPGGRVTRCFWPEELDGMLSASGFTVDWIRPRTVLAEETVTRALRQDPDQLESLVATELALETRRQGESIGGQLVASVRRT